MGVLDQLRQPHLHMSLKDIVADELKRTPVAAISGAASVVVATVTLVIGWMQNKATTPASPTGAAPAGSLSGELFTGNVFLLIAYFLAVTTAASLLLRMIARKHDITALFISVPLIALSNFSVLLLMYLAPPRPISAQLFASAHDLVFYASAAIVIVFCGRAVLADLISTATTKSTAADTESSSKGNEAVGFLLIALALLAFWSWLVFAGQKRLTQTLLPEVTHFVDTKAESKGDGSKSLDAVTPASNGSPNAAPPQPSSGAK
ncbi:MAG: hypothetical protein U1F17_13570 [Burkholderiaceae bacterium]